MKSIQSWNYRGHRIEICESERGPFVIRISGPQCSVQRDTYSLTHIERAIEASIDSAITKKAEGRQS